MNKLAIQETFPPGIVGREIVLAQMCHHYRRISSAKARVDTNLFKPPKISLSRPLSAEVASIVQRSLSPRSPPKHRRCLKYEHEMGEHHIKPSVRSQTAESRLRATPEVYHPAVKSAKPQLQELDGQQQGTQTSLETSLAEEPNMNEPKTRDESVQTIPPGLYRPLDGRSVQFLRDITNDALHRRAFTSSALNRIFLDHQFRNTYGLSQELMERELEELRRQLGMLPRHQTEGSVVSDAEALDALDSLVLDPRIKEQVIHSLRLSRANDAKTFSYFDRLKFDEEDEQPMRDQTSNKLRETLKAMESFGTENGSVELVDEIPLDQVKNGQTPGSVNLATDSGNGWNAEIEDDLAVTSASSSKDEESDAEEGEELVESMTDSAEQSASEEDSNESDEDIEELTQRESTSKPKEESSPKTQDGSSNVTQNIPQADKTIEQSSQIDESLENTEDDESHSFLTPLKLEPTTKGDKWISSLEAVKEESDSTTGQVSDISTASTPTEGESKLGDSRVTSVTASRNQDTKSSGTYHSAESGEPTQHAESDTRDTESAVSRGQSSSSTGGEIVRQMDDLLANVGSTQGTRNGSGKTTIPLSDPEEQLNESKDGDEEDEISDTGSEVESVHTDAEDDHSQTHSDSESDMDSVHTD